LRTPHLYRSSAERGVPFKRNAAFAARDSGLFVNSAGAGKPLTIGPVIVAAGSALFAIPGIGSFTAAISHRERDGKIVLDVLYERRSPFNPSEVVAEIVALMRQYRCSKIVGDKYGAMDCRGVCEG
jgi:hypothetical protein